jgi:hypothetical protein
MYPLRSFWHKFHSCKNRSRALSFACQTGFNRLSMIHAQKINNVFFGHDYHAKLALNMSRLQDLEVFVQVVNN